MCQKVCSAQEEYWFSCEQSDIYPLGQPAKMMDSLGRTKLSHHTQEKEMKRVFIINDLPLRKSGRQIKVGEWPAPYCHNVCGQPLCLQALNIKTKYNIEEPRLQSSGNARLHYVPSA